MTTTETMTPTTETTPTSDPLDFAAPASPPIDLAASSAPAPVAKSVADPDRTADITIGAINLAVSAGWGMPLDADETEALRRDLCAVLRKHDVPNLPYQEEVALAMTTAGIVLKRLAAKGAQNDIAGGGQEGVGQVNGAAAAGVPSAARFTKVHGLLG